MWQNKSFRLLLVAVMAITIVLSGCGTKGKEGAASDDKVVATYEKGQVTESELNSFIGVTTLFNPSYAQYAALDPSFEESMLKQLITMKIMASKASSDMVAKQKKQAQDDFNSLLKEVNSNAQNQANWKSQLTANKITQDDVQQFVELSDLSRAYVESTFSDADIQNKYNEMNKQNQFVVATVRHILIALNDPTTGKAIRTKEEALKRAEEVRAKVNESNFAALAKEYSDDTGSKDNGGEYKDQNVSSWVPEFKDAVLKQPIGVIGQPVLSQYGYHIIEVESRQNQTLAQAKDQVVSQLLSDYLSNFMQKDLPGLIKSTNLPKPAPSTGTGGSTQTGTGTNAGTSTGGGSTSNSSSNSSTSSGSSSSSSN